MTTLTLTIKDESKAVDVVRFLRDIPFLEVGATSTETPPPNTARRCATAPTFRLRPRRNRAVR